MEIGGLSRTNLRSFRSSGFTGTTPNKYTLLIFQLRIFSAAARLTQPLLNAFQAVY